MTNIEKPIRIAHVIGKLNAAGVEAVINNYYRHIDHSKYQFDFFVDSDGECLPPKELIALGARYFVIPPYQHIFKHITTLIRLFKQNKYLIVHSSMNTLSPISLFCAWFAGVPVRINHNHSIAGKGERNNIIKYMLRPFSKFFATHFAACSVVSGEWLFGKNLMRSGSIKIFKNAIEVDKFKFNPTVRQKLRKELGITDKFVLGHVGRFCFAKNHEFLIDVFNAVQLIEPNSVLILIGTGNLRVFIEKKVRSLGLENKVIFLGIRKDVADLYQAMDVFVFPSRYEGLPVVGVEAQSSGVPCIFSDRFTSEAVIVSETKVLSLDDTSAWRNSILKFKTFNRHDTSSAISRAGFDIKNESQQLEIYYDKCVSIICHKI